MALRAVQNRSVLQLTRDANIAEVYLNGTSSESQLSYIGTRNQIALHQLCSKRATENTRNFALQVGVRIRMILCPGYRGMRQRQRQRTAKLGISEWDQRLKFMVPAASRDVEFVGFAMIAGRRGGPGLSP